MTTANPGDQDDNKDKVTETVITKETKTEPASDVKDGDDKKDDDDDDDGAIRDVTPVSSKKGK